MMLYEQLTKEEHTALNTSMFKAYDIRTQSKALTSELKRRLIRALARYFREVLKVDSISSAGTPPPRLGGHGGRHRGLLQRRPRCAGQS